MTAVRHVVEQESVSEEAVPWVAEAERVTSRSDPAAFLDNPDRLATFVEKLRASGVKHFVHPSGLQVSFETGPRSEKDPRW